MSILTTLTTGKAKIALIAAIGTAIIVAGVVVYSLAKGAYKDFITSIENQVTLEETIKDNNELIKQQKQDFIALQKITESNLRAMIAMQKDIKKHEDKFTKLNKSTGNPRDIGVLAINKPDVMSNIVTKASNNILRCFAILMGSPLTEEEINAKKKSEFNAECPEIANPNSPDYKSD